MSERKPVRLNVGTRAEPIPEGLKDGGHVIVRCSNCNAALLDVWRTRPHEPGVWKVRANCPFCGDASYTAEIKGGMHVGGFGTVKDDDPDDDVPSTSWERYDVEGDTFVYTVIKANEHAQPVRN